jgi:hypothetical protein
MAQRADVQSLEALVRLRGAIARFLELVSSAVSEATSDVNQTLHWLEHDRAQFWRFEERKRHEQHQQALEALRMKQLFKGVAGERQSVVDEMKRVKVTRAALEEAQTKLRAVAAHRNRLVREAVLFQGAMARVGSITIQSGPAALAELANLIVALEKYGKIRVEEVVSQVGAEGEGAGQVVGAPAMVRAAAPPQPEEASQAVVDWKAVERRAWKAWRDVAGKVVVEAGAVEAAGAGAGSAMPVALWRDFLRGKLFIGFVGESPTPPPPVCQPLDGGLDRLISVVPALEDVLASPGDKRLLLQDGQIVDERAKGT